MKIQYQIPESETKGGEIQNRLQSFTKWIRSVWHCCFYPYELLEPLLLLLLALWYVCIHVRSPSCSQNVCVSPVALLSRVITSLLSLVFWYFVGGFCVVLGQLNLTNLLYSYNSMYLAHLKALSGSTGWLIWTNLPLGDWLIVFCYITLLFFQIKFTGFCLEICMFLSFLSQKRRQCNNLCCRKTKFLTGHHRCTRSAAIKIFLKWKTIETHRPRKEQCIVLRPS